MAVNIVQPSPVAARSKPTLQQRLRGLLARINPSSGATREILAVDGLRALAIILVFWHHAYSHSLNHGWDVGTSFVAALAALAAHGVDLFFVISGFLLFLPFARAILSGKPMPATGKFYYRRILRIMPLYLFALITLLLFRDPFYLQPGGLKSLLFMVTLLQDFSHQATREMAAVNIVFWTLAVEWQFYLVLPWLARFIAKVSGKPTSRAFFWRMGTVFLAIIVVGLGIRLAAGISWYDYGQFPVDSPNGIGLIWGLFYGVKGKYLETFALGMALCVVYILVVERGQLSRRTRNLLGTLALVIGIAGFIACAPWENPLPLMNPTAPNAWIFGPVGLSWMVLGSWTLGLCFALIVFATLMGPSIIGALFSFGPLRYIGVISYSIYVWHLPLINSVESNMPDNSPHGFIALILKAGVVTLIYCSASYFMIERPFLSLRRKAHSAQELQPVASPVVSAGTLVPAGVATTPSPATSSPTV